MSNALSKEPAASPSLPAKPVESSLTTQPTDTTQKDERSFLGVTLADLSKTVIGLVVGVLLTLFGFWLTARSPHLKVTVPETIMYKGEKNQVSILNVTVTNDGSKEAEEVECWLLIPGTKVQEVKAGPDQLAPVVTTKENKVQIAVKTLNPREDFTISALLNTPEKLTEQPKVEVRGKGVIGEREAKSQLSILEQILIIMLTVTLSGVASAIVQAQLLYKKEREERAEILLTLKKETDKAKEMTAKAQELVTRAEEEVAKTEEITCKVAKTLKRVEEMTTKAKEMVDKAEETEDTAKQQSSS